MSKIYYVLTIEKLQAFKSPIPKLSNKRIRYITIIMIPYLRIKHNFNEHNSMIVFLFHHSKCISCRYYSCLMHTECFTTRMNRLSSIFQKEILFSTLNTDCTMIDVFKKFKMNHILFYKKKPF